MRIKCPDCANIIDAKSMGQGTRTLRSWIADEFEDPVGEVAAFSCPYCGSRSSDTLLSTLTVVES